MIIENGDYLLFEIFINKSNEEKDVQSLEKIQKNLKIEQLLDENK